MIGRRSPRTVLVLSSVLLLGVVLFFTREKPQGLHTVPSVKPEKAPSDNAPPTPASTAPSAAVSLQPSALPPTAAVRPAQCQRDSECLGPHSADCVRAHCVDHRCVYDDRACACQNNAQCDDGNPCTTDLCFSRTNACVHVEEGCSPSDVTR